jgi:hypothetical protein
VVTDAALLAEIWDATPLLRHDAVNEQVGVVGRADIVAPEQVRFMREWSLEYYDVLLESHCEDGSPDALSEATAERHATTKPRAG